MIKFIIIGLICNSQECYWVQADQATYTDYKPCKNEADKLHKNSVMYHDTNCMVKDTK